MWYCRTLAFHLSSPIVLHRWMLCSILSWAIYACKNIRDLRLLEGDVRVCLLLAKLCNLSSLLHFQPLNPKWGAAGKATAQHTANHNFRQLFLMLGRGVVQHFLSGNGGYYYYLLQLFVLLLRAKLTPRSWTEGRLFSINYVDACHCHVSRLQQ